jgi:hypothetical protein
MIAEESEAHSVTSWKVNLVNKRKRFMMMDEDEMEASF